MQCEAWLRCDGKTEPETQTPGTWQLRTLELGVKCCGLRDHDGLSRGFEGRLKCLWAKIRDMRSATWRPDQSVNPESHFLEPQELGFHAKGNTITTAMDMGRKGFPKTAGAVN